MMSVITGKIYVTETVSVIIGFFRKAKPVLVLLFF